MMYPLLPPVIEATLPSNAMKENKMALGDVYGSYASIGVMSGSSSRKKEVMKHLNPQLQTVMKDSDFKAAELFLFGEEFEEKA